MSKETGYPKEFIREALKEITDPKEREEKETLLRALGETLMGLDRLKGIRLKGNRTEPEIPQE